MRLSTRPQQQQPERQVQHARTAHGVPPLLLRLGQLGVMAGLGLGQSQDAPLKKSCTLLPGGLQLNGCEPQLVAVLGVAETGLCYMGGITGVALCAGVATV